MELDKARRGEIEGLIKARTRVNRRPALEKLRVGERPLRLEKLLPLEMRLQSVLRPRWEPPRRPGKHQESGNKPMLDKLASQPWAHGAPRLRIPGFTPYTAQRTALYFALMQQRICMSCSRVLSAPNSSNPNVCEDCDRPPSEENEPKAGMENPEIPPEELGPSVGDLG